MQWKRHPLTKSHFVGYEYLTNVYPVLAQTSLCICAVLQCSVAVPYGENITYARREWSGEAAHLCSLARAFADCTKKKECKWRIRPNCLSFNVIQVLIAYASSERPGEPAHSHSLARDFAYCTRKKGYRWRLRHYCLYSYVLYFSHIRTSYDQACLHLRTVSSQPLLLELKKKRCRWRFRPNFGSSKTVVLLLLIHSLMSPHWFVGALCSWSSFCYKLLSVLPRFAIILTRKREHDALLYCLSTISVLWLFLTMKISHMRAANDLAKLHICAVSPEPSLIALKEGM